VHSFTEPRTNLFNYPQWLLGTGASRVPADVEGGKVSGKNLVAKIAGVDDRDAAAALIGTAISVSRSALPPCAPGEFYWADLEGLQVLTLSRVHLGTVDRLVATGANDVIVLDGGRMIPFVANAIVKTVDLDAREIIVDWDPSYWE
jgi:16S rRNA processing protein RimM